MWQAVERTRTVLQIIVAVLMISGALSAWLRISVPGWFTVLLVACGLGVGLYLGRHFSAGSTVGLNRQRHLPVIDRIDFRYPDEPTAHGWRISYDKDGPRGTVYFQTKIDPELGRYARIEAPTGARIEYELSPGDHIAEAFEVRYRPESGSAFYVRSTAAGSGERRWIQYKIGNDSPKRLNANEWLVCVKYLPLPGKWLHLCRNITKDFDSTFGQDGLRLDHISGFRIRGSMDLLNICLFRSESG